MEPWEENAEGKGLGGASSHSRIHPKGRVLHSLLYAGQAFYLLNGRRAVGSAQGGYTVATLTATGPCKCS